MKLRKGSANSMLILMLLASITLNVAYASRVQRFIGHFKSEPPEKVVEYRDNPEHVKSVAQKLGVRVLDTDTAGDIARNIREVVVDSERKMPVPLSDETIAKFKKLLKPDERLILDKYQKAIKEAQGKKVLYLSKEAK